MFHQTSGYFIVLIDSNIFFPAVPDNLIDNANNLLTDNTPDQLTDN
jgi:hypothetical protein